MTALQVTPGSGQTVFCLPYIPLGYQQLTSLASVTTLTVPTGATAALIVCEVLVAVAGGGAGANYVPTNTITLADGAPTTHGVLTVSTTGVSSATVNAGGTTCTGAVAICVGMIPALSSGINLSDHAARSMI